MAPARERSKEANQERILKAALDLFGARGFEKTSVESITRKARVAKGTFYNFFEKKEDVLLYFLDREYVKSEAEIALKRSERDTFIDRIELSVSAYIKHIFPGREFTKVLIKERIGNIGTGRNKNELRLMEELFRSIERAKHKREIRAAVDSRRLTEMIFALYTMYVIYWTNGFIKTKKECVARIKQAVQYILQGVESIKP
jgi:TetR/AcrR family transcriptional regulator, cholesterol catabolism regulator